MKQIDAEIGDVIHMYYSGIYHVAMIVNTFDTGYLIHEDWCGEKRTRFVSKFDEHIIGFLDF